MVRAWHFNIYRTWFELHLTLQLLQQVLPTRSHSWKYCQYKISSNLYGDKQHFFFIICTDIHLIFFLLQSFWTVSKPGSSSVLIIISDISITSVVNNGFQAIWLVVWLVNLRYYLLPGFFSTSFCTYFF